MLVGCQERESQERESQERESADGQVQQPAQNVSAGVVQDVPLETFQRQLLQLAFDAASKFPSNPHTKNRGRAQDLVVTACFEMEQPLLAASMAPKVEGWRRGVAYADFAWCCAKANDEKAAKRYLKLAGDVLDGLRSDANAQDWRADKVRIKIARAWRTLGDASKADQAIENVSPASAGAVDRSWTGTMASHLENMTVARASSEIERITDTFLSQSLGEQYTSLMLISGLHGRFFDDQSMRADMEERLFVRFQKLPTNLRLDAMAPLVGHYVAHEDLEGARNVIHKMTTLMDEFSWRPEERMPQLARVAELRHLIGDRDRARQEMEQALKFYNEQRDQIVNIYRCEALRPLALAWLKLKDPQQADDLLALCVEEALDNPNSRPRCDDLVETCVAMARHGHEPSAALWRRLREVSNGLSSPW